MPYNIYNLTEEDRGAEIITADAPPALTITNLSTAGVGLQLISGASTQLLVRGATPASLNTGVAQVLIQSGSTVGSALEIGRTVAGSPTVALMRFGTLSAASAPYFEFSPGGGYVSVTSIVLTTVANFIGAVRVKVGSSYGWLPVIADAGLVGAGAF